MRFCSAPPGETRRGGRRAALAVVLVLPLAGCAVVGVAEPSAGPVPTVVPTADVTTAPPSRPGPSAPTREPSAPAEAVLGRGDSGPAVLALQQRLAALDYWLGEPDGRFGLLTRQAVLAIQGVAGLDRDGRVGPRTRAALASGVRFEPRSASGAVTEIDRGAGVIGIVRDGAVVLVLHTSTGTFDRYDHEGRTLLADTPKGEFEVAWAFDGWRDGELGRLYRPRYFHPDGIAVHGYSNVPAYPTSHGCARVTIAAMDMLWARDLMPRGSGVLVY